MMYWVTVSNIYITYMYTVCVIQTVISLLCFIQAAVSDEDKIVHCPFPRTDCSYQ